MGLPLQQYFLKDVAPFRGLFARHRLDDPWHDRPRVLEIGVGTGVLTRAIAEAYGGFDNIVGIEIDSALVPNDIRAQAKIIDGDARQVDFEALCLRSSNYLIANPPYALLGFIATEVLPFCCGAIFMVPESKLGMFPSAKVEFVLGGDAFNPPALGQHMVVSIS